MNAERRERAAELRDAGRQAHAEAIPRTGAPDGLNESDRAHWQMGWWDAERDTREEQE